MSEIPVIRVSALEGESPDADHPGVLVSRWAQVEVPRARRPSPTTIAVIATLAGIGAMALGTAAVLRAPDSATTTVVTTIAPAVTTGIEPQVLALLAKPSTQRMVLSRSGGRLVLAVGSGGRAAILLGGGLERAAPGKPYVAWVIAPGSRPVRGARFVGTERAVFLSVRLRPKTSVVVSTERPVGKAWARRDAVATLR